MDPVPDTPVEIVKALLADPTNLTRVRALVAESATYVSLNADDPDLTRIMPWCGTGHGPDRIVETFVRVRRYWETLAFDIETIFGAGENVAVFGHFTYRSTKLGRVVTSPFAVFAKVQDGQITFMQFMEDTFVTAASFRASGVWRFESDPEGGVVAIGDAE